MSPLPATRCAWCAKDLPANANAVLDGIAVRDPESDAWLVRRVSQLGIGDAEWIVGEVADIADGSLYEGDEAVVVLSEDYPDWRTVADETGTALADARARLSMAMHAAEVVGACAYEDGVPEAEVARRLGVDRMTVRKWLGKR